jgi:hypothetical protein
LSVQLSAKERRRLAVHAKSRRLKVATAARIFIDEHLSELEDRAELSAVEEWQRAQAWATWDKIKAGDVDEASEEDIRAVFDDARRRQARRRSRAG